MPIRQLSVSGGLTAALGSRTATTGQTAHDVAGRTASDKRVHWILGKPKICNNRAMALWLLIDLITIYLLAKAIHQFEQIWGQLSQTLDKLGKNHNVDQIASRERGFTGLRWRDWRARKRILEEIEEQRPDLKKSPSPRVPWHWCYNHPNWIPIGGRSRGGEEEP